MIAQEFNQMFDEVVGGPLASIDAYSRGRRIFYADAHIQAALLRVEHRYQPPAELLLTVRHHAMRDMNGELLDAPPSSPLEYPIKIGPRSARKLVSGDWVYDPQLAISYRGVPDEIDYPFLAPEDCRQALQEIADSMKEALPQLASSVSAKQLLDRIRAASADTWIERRWISDLEAAAE